MKKCSKCGRVLPDSAFAGEQHMCKLCRRDYDWKRNYNITPEQYYYMWKQQGGKCAICGKKLPDGKYLAVDHDWKTGKVRGLLCSKCNTSLGLLEDNTERLEKAKQYLEGNKQEDKCQEQ